MDATDSRISQTEDRRLIAEFLRRQLSQAMVVKITNDKAEKGLCVWGDGGTHPVRSPLQPLQHQGGIFLIELSISSKIGKALEMRYAVPPRINLGWGI